VNGSDEGGSLKSLYYADWQALKNGWTARAKFSDDVGRAEGMKKFNYRLRLAHRAQP